MNLTQLQAELREIEKRLSSLHTEIESMKMSKTDDSKDDYEKIAALAKRHPITGTALDSASDSVKTLYISALAYLFVIGSENSFERLLYLCRLSEGCGCGMSVEDICMEGLQFGKTDFVTELSELGKRCYDFLLNALILANISDGDNGKWMDTVANAALLLNCDKDDLRVIAQVAKSVITQNFNLLNAIPAPKDDRWSEVFNGFIPERWLVKKRIEQKFECANPPRWDKPYTWYTDNTSHRLLSIKWANDGAIVNKGDYFKIKEKTLIASCGGMLLLSDDTAYIVSYFDNYNSFKKWVQHQVRRNKNVN